MAEATAQVEAVLSLVEPILQFLFAQRVPKRFEIRELTHCVCVQLINTGKSFFTNGLLVIG